MKKIILFGALIGMTVQTYSQSLNEDFESWPAGSYMGVNSPAWTTWSGSTGGAEDVVVTTANASNGTKSIYFSGTTSGGGPQDVVVPFGGQYNTGQFLFESKFFVQTGKGAYFNFQGTTTIGQIWSLNCQMVQTGQLVLDDGAGASITTTYPIATWFTLTLDINLNTNDWELLIDGVSQGVLQTATNQLASIDIFPVNAQYGGNNQSGFYMEEFSYLHTPYAMPALNAAVFAINNVDGLAGQLKSPSATVRNLGTNPITSFDLTLDYNGTQLVENVTGVNIPSLGTYDVDFTGTISLIAGINPVSVTVSNVNFFSSDMDASDDTKIINVNPLVPAAGKMVVGEEGTGTWCQWCPRGAVFMDMMSTEYDGYFVGIAVHNGDPMANTVYDDGIGPLLGGGYPSAVVDRLPVIDPSALEVDFLNRIVIAPKATITNGASYNSTSGILSVSVTADFVQSISGNYRLACVITEDGVTGTGAGWSQSNAYAGGGSGVMGGYELLPNPVPASQMVYDHVARAILPDFNGQPNSFTATVASGATHTLNFDVTVDPSWDLNNIHIIGLLIDPTGKIDNAGTATKAEAEANGFIDVTGIKETVVGPNLNLYPNPTSDMSNVTVGNVENEVVTIKIIDINGRVVGEKNYGELSGEINLPVTTGMLEAGVYVVQVTVGNSLRTSRLVVE